MDAVLCAEDTMARSILHVYLLLTVIYAADGQSTAADPHCVYTFNVPASECDQTPGSSVDDQVWKNSVIALQAQVQQLTSVTSKLSSDTSKLTSDNRKLARVVESLQRELANSNTGTADHTSTGGAVYIRWGRKVCPENGTDLLYWGSIAGPHYTHTGGGSNLLCMHRDPEWGPKTTAGFQSNGNLYGAEYSMAANDPFSKANAQSLQDNDVPCAVCLVASRPTKLMVPGRLTCPGGWTKEYSGYLMAERYAHKGRTTYVCVDNAPEVIEGGAEDKDGVIFRNVEAACGSLPCPNYEQGWEITCVVCTK